MGIAVETVADIFPPDGLNKARCFREAVQICYQIRSGPDGNINTRTRYLLCGRSDVGVTVPVATNG